VQQGCYKCAEVVAFLNRVPDVLLGDEQHLIVDGAAACSLDKFSGGNIRVVDVAVPGVFIQIASCRIISAAHRSRSVGAILPRLWRTGRENNRYYLVAKQCGAVRGICLKLSLGVPIHQAGFRVVLIGPGNRIPQTFAIAVAQYR
jgi:hypothetical protein